MMKLKLTSVLLACCFFWVQNKANAQSPDIEWQKSYWAPEHPVNGPQVQNESGEDWFYDLKKSVNSSGQVDGFISAGYSTMVEWAAFENFGCLGRTLGNPRPWFFESAGNRMGTGLASLTRLDLNGNVLWYKTYAEGWFNKVIQTTDGGYLAIGVTQSTENSHNPNPAVKSLIDYNPNQNATFPVTEFESGISCNVGDNVRKIYLVKTDSGGEIEWEYIYGMEEYDFYTFFPGPQNGTQAYSFGSVGWDVVETPNGDFLFTGCAASDNQGMRTSVMRVDASGMWLWGKYYGNPYHSNLGTKIEKYFDSGSVQYIIAGREYYGPSGSPSPKFGAFAFQIDDSYSPGYGWLKNYGLYFNLNSFIFDFVINSNNEILMPIGTDCVTCTAADGEAIGNIYRADATTGNLIGSPISFGTVKAFDLRIGITNTMDGGFAVVSSKQPNGVPSSPANGYHGWCWCGKDFWETDAFVAKYDANYNLTWSKTFDSNTTTPPGAKSTWYYPDPQMRDLKKQECMYAIVESPEGGLLVAGNNSANFDDSYVTKIEACSPPLDLGPDITLCTSASLQHFYLPSHCVTGANAPTITWSFNGSPIVSAASCYQQMGGQFNSSSNVAGTYSVEISYPFCSDTLRDTLVFTLTPGPCDVEPDFVFWENHPCEFQFNDVSVIGSGMTNVTYYWDFGDGNTSNQMNPIHTYGADGNYNVTLTITAMNSCGNLCGPFVISYDIDAKGCRSHSMLASDDENHLFVFPNPTADFVAIHVNGFDVDQEIHLRIEDLDGKLVYEETSKNVNQRIDMSDWQNGVYVFTVRCNNETISKKVQKIGSK